MGIFSDIVDGLTKKFYEIKLNNIYKQLLDYYSDYENKLKYDNVIHFSERFVKLYKEYTKLLNEVGKEGKYIFLKNDIKKLDDKIKIHNEEIKSLNDSIKEYDFDLSKEECLFKCDSSFFSTCDNIVESLNKFNCLSAEFQSFIRNYEKVKSNRLKYINECESFLNKFQNLLNKSISIDESKISNYQNILQIQDALMKNLIKSDEIKVILNSYLDRFCKLKEELLVHNNSVAYIDSQVIQSYEFINKILLSPTLDNLNLVHHFNDLLNIIEKFQVKIGAIGDFYNKVYQIDKDKSLILEQFSIYESARKIYEQQFNDKYYDMDYIDCTLSKMDELKEKLQSYKNIYYSIENFFGIYNEIIEHNKKFINKHLCDDIFDNVNGLKLDKDQRRAILTDEVAQLVVAGAGSGKTLTICGKVKYLLDVKKIPADKILLLSYSNASAKDLLNKVKNIDDKLTVSTFHALGLKMLKESANIKQTINDQNIEKYIYSYIQTGMYRRNCAASKLLSYYALFLSPMDNNNRKYKTEGDLYQELKSKNFDTLKKQLINLTKNVDKKETIKSENVKSYEELVIANYYFINGIKYDYEKPYQECKTATNTHRQYLPDFYLRDYNIYHEHYGIDREGRARQFSKELEEKYIQLIKWKRELHKEFNTISLETYSYQFKDSTIFNVLDDNLKKFNIKKQPLSLNQVKKIFDCIHNNKNFISIIKLITTFINLYKSNYRDNSYFPILREFDYKNAYLNERKNLFLDVCEDIYNYYMSEIRSDEKIDFDDMIIMASEKLEEIEDFKYDYIIVDEFQDISQSRLKFIQRLIAHGKSKLFAVGDDWQAIYRFSGCDIHIFTNFKEYFNKSTINFISKTYRNPKQVHEIVEPFIMKNRAQIKKDLKTEISLENPIRIYYYSKNKLGVFYEILEEINKRNMNAEVLVLGRNNFDINYFQTFSQNIIRYPDGRLVVMEYPSLKLKYKTVHASKGLESEYVILINADNLRNGFPNQIEDDILLDLVLAKNDKYPYAEERRLWYVALTRAKKFTYIISDEENPSVFVKEIEKKCYVKKTTNDYDKVNIIDCPNCKSGKLVIRTNPKNNKQFFGCSNFPYCHYTNRYISAVKLNKKCPVCGDFLLECNGKYGKFYRCTNKGCNYTCNIDDYTKFK